MAFLEYRPTGPLYHYCSPAAFEGILGSKKLWFSDLKAANDPRELHFSYEKITSSIQGVIDRGSFPGKHAALQEFLARLKSSYNRANVFSSCLSLEGDSLPMWREYGAEYEGVALGFRPTALTGLPVRIQRVRYLDDNSLEDYRRFAEELVAQTPDEGSREDVYASIVNAASAMAIMTAVKHETWSYEREVRLVHMQRQAPPEKGENPIFSFTGLLPDGGPVTWSKPFERHGVYGPVKYLEFPFGRFRAGLFDPARSIASVTIGPKCQLSASDVSEIMRANGFQGFTVRTSRCLIR